jgi:chemotaxis regulatin CheY-phosphate phosphatase CheZ
MAELPIINLELNSGQFRIKTLDAIYVITVNTDSSLTRVVEKVVEKEVVRPPVRKDEDAGLEPVEPYYQELTAEIYSEIGRLARQLSLSIKEIPGKSFKGIDIEQTGVELEDAKGQLEDIVQMTEKATMDIMDLAENIQEDLQQVETKLGAIRGLDFMNSGSEDMDWGEDSDESGSFDDPVAEHPRHEQQIVFMQGFMDLQRQLREIINGLPRPGDDRVAPESAPQPAEPETKKITTYQFDLDVVFQTLYEFCTNETVKDHIKAMRTDQSTAFDQRLVLTELEALAPTAEREDNFFNLPIVAILKSLFQATENSKYKNVLKKMNQTAGSIFLDSVLPLEGQVQEKEIEVQTVAPAPSASTEIQSIITEEDVTQLLKMIDQGLLQLEEEKSRLESDTGTASDGRTDQHAGYTCVQNEDRDKIIESIETTNSLVQNIMGRITGILEALSFQDLSGQRILKIVRLISDVQIQLLSLLVSYGAKIKKKKEGTHPSSREETEKLVQTEVDKMLERVSPQPSELQGPEAEGRLNQDAVDTLLADLGF